jgi:decaprenylphospho-beta-D-ribofuranose 2-oxidase
VTAGERLEVAAPDPPHTLCGWGRTAPTGALVALPTDGASTADLLRGRSAPVIARGCGRSYGDAAQCSGGLVVETQGLDELGEVDDESGTIEVGGGVSLHRLVLARQPGGT